VKPHGTTPGKHTHIIFTLDDGRDLWFDDVRKFGYLKLATQDEIDELNDGEKFGPEPLNAKFTSDIFRACLMKRSKKLIKPLLMEPGCIAGVGNIYADEALWLAHIRPTRRVGTLTKAETAKLHDGIITTLQESLKHRGASAENYRDLYDTEGKSMNFLKAYAQTSCERCKGKMKKIVIGARSAHYCPHCQK
jgi:formamidopyrimidine-DNA glycosylase